MYEARGGLGLRVGMGSGEYFGLGDDGRCGGNVCGGSGVCGRVGGGPIRVVFSEKQHVG